MAAPPTMPTNLRQQFPSMASVSSTQTMLSLGYLPPGHGYVPKKQKPDKPYGLTFVTRMNRTARGPGRKYLNYALACLITSFLLFLGAAIYFGHRNVSRMIVYRTEVIGALLVMAGICFFSLMGHYLYKARVESNRWRANIRFRPEGLFTAAAFNDEYVPEVCIKQDLRTGTYGPKALKEIPKPKATRKKKKKRRAQSKESLLSDDSLDSGGAGRAAAPAEPRLYERRGAPRSAGSMERILEEPPEYNGRGNEAVPQYYDNAPGRYYDNVPPPQAQQPFYSDQPGMGAYYDNAPSPVSPYVPDPEGYYMRGYPQQQAPPSAQNRSGLEESAF